MISDYVDIVKSNPDRNWDSYLKPQDWEVINSQVLASTWYPYDTFRRIAYAIFKEVAGGNLEAVRAYGRHSMKDTIKIYKNILIEGEPVESIKKLGMLTKTFFDLDVSLKIVEEGEKMVKVKPQIPQHEDEPEAAIAYFHQLRGSLEGLVGQAGGKNVDSSLENTEDIHNTVIAVTWE